MPAAAVLITIPLSHYCEKARWALDRADLAYTEDPHAPLFHRLATRRGERGTVPVLVHLGRRYADSTAILRHADATQGGDVLYPRDAVLSSDVEALEETFDTRLGPHSRRWAYAELLGRPEVLDELWSRGVPRYEALFMPLIAPLTRRLVRAAYKVTADGAQRSLHQVQAVFQQVDRLLSDGRRFLVGGRFSAADLTFASLAAPTLYPPGYRAVHPPLEAMSAATRVEVERLRDTAAGQFALRLFAEERGA
jgi:glutathione S-transferase